MIQQHTSQVFFSALNDRIRTFRRSTAEVRYTEKIPKNTTCLLINTVFSNFSYSVVVSNFKDYTMAILKGVLDFFVLFCFDHEPQFQLKQMEKAQHGVVQVSS